MKHLGDITKLDGATIEPVWCVTGGSPCQDLSIAGKRAGLAGARSGLFDGIGGFPLCWEDVHGAGTAVWASEIEEFPIAVTKKRFGSGNMIRYTLNIEPPVEPPAYTCPICPVCGEEADTLYKDRQGNVIGCTACITEVDAWTL